MLNKGLIEMKLGKIIGMAVVLAVMVGFILSAGIMGSNATNAVSNESTSDEGEDRPIIMLVIAGLGLLMLILFIVSRFLRR